MVSVEDITKEEKLYRENFNKAKYLTERVFGHSFKISFRGKITIYVEEENSTLLRIYPIDNYFVLHKKEYESFIKKFGAIYQKVLGLKDLEMMTDYS